jgi:hypothetical protein
MNKRLVDNTGKLTPSSPIPRIKSLIKPLPSRRSWELLLDDYLKDPNLKSNLTSQPIPSNPIQPTFVPLSYPSYETNRSPLPPRRYQMNLDELVYLISQVGRSDLYREMVQFIKAQQLPTTASSHPVHQASNVNACSTDQSFFLDRNMKHKPYFSPQVQDELIKKLTQLKINRKKPIITRF